MRNREALNQFWEEEPHAIRAFLEMRPTYEKLAEEVAYILRRAVKETAVEYSTITYRAKAIDSFCEKVVRKKHKNPLNEITDLAGVRIVYLYTSDRQIFESLIEKEFIVLEKVDKVAISAPEQFGYGTLHYLIKLGQKAKGARYDDLKDLICEVQVRTILQDAWAVVAHHLSYKQESDVPKNLRRKLNALSGLFETADDQFNRIKEERFQYKDEIKQTIAQNTSIFLGQDIDLDNLVEYLNWKFPDRKSSPVTDVSDLLTEINKQGYRKIKQLDEAIDRAYDALMAYEADHRPIDEETGEITAYTPEGATRVALSLVDDEFLEGRSVSCFFRQQIHSYRNMLKDE